MGWVGPILQQVTFNWCDFIFPVFNQTHSEEVRLSIRKLVHYTSAEYSYHRDSILIYQTTGWLDPDSIRAWKLELGSTIEYP